MVSSVAFLAEALPTCQEQGSRRQLPLLPVLALCASRPICSSFAATQGTACTLLPGPWPVSPSLHWSPVTCRPHGRDA